MSFSLESLGWTPALAFTFDETIAAKDPSLQPARVVRVDGPVLRVRSPSGEQLARLSGRFLAAAQRALDRPTVGDWVAVRVEGEAATVHALVERRGLLSRLRPGGAAHVEEQALAANVDVVLLTSPLDRHLRPRRLEREVTLAYDSGASPVIVLTKADVLEEEAARAAATEVERAFLGVPVVVASALAGGGLADVVALLPPRKTGVLFGPSGAGKSTLVNALVGHERMATTPVREDDGRGRHTTTHRELIVLAHGALLIDGPGVREVGLASSDESLAEAFADVAALAEGCRFRDCSHGEEPGCAVKEALAGGVLAEGRYQSFLKLRREAAFARSKIDDAAKQERKANEKKLARAIEEVKERKSRR